MEKVLRFSRLLSIFKGVVEYFDKVSQKNVFSCEYVVERCESVAVNFL